MGAIATEIDLTAPAPAAQGLFSCSAPGAISAPFESSGLHDVREADVQADLYVESAHDYWHFMTDIAAPVVAALAELDDDARRRIGMLVIDKVREFEVDNRPNIPARARCIVATK